MSLVSPMPAYGLAWHTLRRHRSGIAALAAYLTFMVTLVHVQPKIGREQIVVASIIPLTFGLLYLIAAFTNSDADFAATSTGYPSHLLVLPVRTRDLVFWPFFWGAALLAAVWLVVSRFVLGAVDVPVPVLWPIALLASLLACLQAIVWSPLSLPYLRAVLATLLLPGIIIAETTAYSNGVSESLLTVANLVLVAVAYLASLSSLARARRGDMALPQLFPRRKAEDNGVDESSLRQRPPFHSPAQAQFWLEWSRNGLGLPLFVGSACLLFTLPFLFVHDSLPLSPFAASGGQAEGIGQIEVNVCMRVAMVCLSLPVWFASILGCGARKSDTRRKDLTVQPFLAVRPVTSSDLVLAKLKAAALSALATWGVMLLFIAVWLLTPARDGQTTGPLGFLLLRYLTPRSTLLILLGLAGLVALTWKSQVESLCIDLTGRRWIVYGSQLLLSYVVTAALFVAAHAFTDPGFLRNMLSLLPYLAMAALALKLMTGTWALSALVHRRLLGRRLLVKLSVVWVLTASTLFASLSWLLPDGLIAPRSLALGIALSIPLARLALAPLALDWNRHR